MTEKLYNVDVFFDGNGDKVDCNTCIMWDEPVWQVSDKELHNIEMQRIAEYYNKCPFVCNHG